MSKRQAVKVISFLWIGSLLGAGCAFLTQVVLARQLGPGQFGLFASALAMTTLFAPLASFGIAGYWLKVFGQEGWKAMRWLPGSFSFSALSTFVVVAMLVIWSFFGPNDPVTAKILPILSFYILGQVALELVSGKLQLEERYTSLALWQFLPHFARLVLIVFLAYFPGILLDVQIVVLSYAVIAILIFLTGVIQLHHMYSGAFLLNGHAIEGGLAIQEKVVHPGILMVASQAWPFGMGGIFYLIYYQSDIILLKYLVGAEAAGIYNVAFLVMSAVYLLPSVVYQKFMLPKLHRWANFDKERFYDTYRRGSLLMLTGGTVAMLFLWGVLPWVIPAVFGVDYQGAVLLLQILAFAAPVRFLASSLSSVLTAKNLMKMKIGIMGLAALLNIAINLILIPTYGELGAAVATLITELILLLAFYMAVTKYVLFEC